VIAHRDRADVREGPAAPAAADPYVGWRWLVLVQTDTRPGPHTVRGWTYAVGVTRRIALDRARALGSAAGPALFYRLRRGADVQVDPISGAVTGDPADLARVSDDDPSPPAVGGEVTETETEIPNENPNPAAPEAAPEDKENDMATKTKSTKKPARAKAAKAPAKKAATAKAPKTTAAKATKAAATKKPRAPRDPQAPAVGTTIERTFKGETYRLKVTAEGYALGDVTFRTLTAAAKHVTKYPSISGPRFWLTEQDGAA
jgi:hypothetical protein